MRLIDADTLTATLGITDMDCNKCAWHDREWSNCKRGGDFEDACCAIENAPTIEERKTGKWLPDKHDMAGYGYFDCSECGANFYDVYDFCPNCGADMREQP